MRQSQARTLELHARRVGGRRFPSHLAAANQPNDPADVLPVVGILTVNPGRVRLRRTLTFAPAKRCPCTRPEEWVREDAHPPNWTTGRVRLRRTLMLAPAKGITRNHFQRMGSRGRSPSHAIKMRIAARLSAVLVWLERLKVGHVLRRLKGRCPGTG